MAETSTILKKMILSTSSLTVMTSTISTQRELCGTNSSKDSMNHRCIISTTGGLFTQQIFIRSTWSRPRASSGLILRTYSCSDLTPRWFEEYPWKARSRLIRNMIGMKSSSMLRSLISGEMWYFSSSKIHRKSSLTCTRLSTDSSGVLSESPYYMDSTSLTRPTLSRKNRRCQRRRKIPRRRSQKCQNLWTRAKVLVWWWPGTTTIPRWRN